MTELHGREMETEKPMSPTMCRRALELLFGEGSNEVKERYPERAKLFIVGVDYHNEVIMNQSTVVKDLRGTGRWCVCAKTGPEAENLLKKHIGRSHGLVSWIHVLKENMDGYDRYMGLEYGQCVKTV